MVHRAFLDDPELTSLDFSNITMPLPQDEPRIAPKLMQSLAHNKNLKEVVVNNCNIQNQQGSQLAEALKTNTTLQVLSIESNNFTSAIIDIANTLKEHTESSISQWRFAQQMGHNYFGRPVEQALAEMMEKNVTILKL